MAKTSVQISGLKYTTKLLSLIIYLRIACIQHTHTHTLDISIASSSHFYIHILKYTVKLNSIFVLNVQVEIHAFFK